MGGWVAALTAARETAFGVILISAGDRAKQVHVATDHSWWTVGSGYPGKSSTGSRRFARRRADRRESVRGPDDEHDIRARTAAAHTNQERVDVKEADRLSFRPGPEYDSLMGIRHAFVLPLVVLGCVNSRHAEVRLANNPDGADCFTRCVQTTQGAASVDCVATCPGAHRDSGACSGGACVEERKISTSKSALLLIAVAAVALFAFGGGGGAE